MCSGIIGQWYDTVARRFYRLTVMLTFIFLNVLTPIALAKAVFLYYPTMWAKSSTGDFMECLYWAIAIMAFLCNTSYIALSIWNNFFGNWPRITNCLIHPNCPIPSDASVYKDEVLTLVAIAIIIPSAVFAELLVSVLAVKDVFHNQRSQRCGGQCLFP